MEQEKITRATRYAVGDRVRFTQDALRVERWAGSVVPDRRVHEVVRLGPAPMFDLVLDKGGAGGVWDQCYLEHANS